MAVKVATAIKMDLKKTGWEGTDWGKSGSGQGQLVDSCKHDNEHASSIKCGRKLSQCHFAPTNPTKHCDITKFHFF